ncbi:MAG: hypothetical protein HQ534_08895 [Armatimonadetes bacterium]|nr:hypothetical protein [Armatimonadota bacterium]
MKKIVLTLVLILTLSLPIFATLPTDFDPNDYEEITWEEAGSNFTIIYQGTNVDAAYSIIKINGTYYIVFE